MSNTPKVTYSEFPKRVGSSSVWDNFTVANDRNTAKCKICEKIIKTGGGSTSGLHTHMRTLHKKSTPSTSSSTPSTSSLTPSTSSAFSRPANLKSRDGPPQKKVKLTDYFHSMDSMQMVVTRLAAVDGIPLSKFCFSEELRRLFLKSGYMDLPKSPTTIATIVLTQKTHHQNEIKKMISDLKRDAKRFGVTLDEYTATNNKRYMNINIHNKDLPEQHNNLGLVRIEGSMNAAAGLQYLKNRLSDFDLNLETDVIALTTDAASVMTKMGKEFGGYHQLCMAHGIQLAVIDVLYKYKFENPPIFIASSPQTVGPKSDSDGDNVDDHNEENREDFLNILPPSPTVPADRQPEFIYKTMIEKVRKIVKLFRKSPTKNDTLQSYITASHGRTMNLILDCKTRWSSMSDMLERFLRVREAVAKALIDLNIPFPLSEDEMDTVDNICSSLAVIKATVLAICKRDANLLTADIALQFMLKKLDGRRDHISMNLATALRQRIKQRRTPASGVLQYLHDAERYFNDDADEDTFKKPKGPELHQNIVSLLSRLQYRKAGQTPSTPLQSAEMIEEIGEEITLEQELEREMAKTRQTVGVSLPSPTLSRRHHDMDLDGIVRVEMCVYDSSGGGREVFLTAAYNYLLSIVPTSVESERAFSSVGYLCNKLRSSLSDDMLDALSFLRANLQKKNTS